MFSSFRKNTCFTNPVPILVLIYQLLLYFQVSMATSTITLTSLTSSVNMIWPSGISSTEQCRSSSAGDFNGDGLDDLLCGLQGYNYGSNPQPSSGSAYIIFGTATSFLSVDLNNLGSSQGVWIAGNANDWLSPTVNSVGDVNLDGVDDIILAASNLNRAYIIFGTETPSNIDLALSLNPQQEITITGASGTSLGTSVSSAGDFNGDGINDVMVSAPRASGNQGIVYIIFGRSSMSNIDLTAGINTPNGIQIVGIAGDKLGSSLSKAGDVNNDGIDDVIIGAQQSSCTSNPVNTCGKVVVIYGTKTPTSPIYISSMPLSQGITITGTSQAPIGGPFSISSAGDVNNDGVDDLALGSPNFSPTTASSAGLTYIIYGKTGGLPGNIDLSLSFDGFTITGSTSGGLFGKAITTGDLNNDGLSDLIVGSAGGPNIIYIFFGNKYGLFEMDLSSADYKMPQVLKISDTTSSYLDIRLDVAKDINKDGVNDIVLGGSLKAYALYGSACDNTVICSSLSSSPICYVSKGCVCGEFSQSFYQNECVSSCPQGYYSNVGICEACPSTCTACTSASVCQSCIDGYILKETSCESICPTGYHLIDSDCQSDDVSSLDEIQTINSVTNVTDTVNSATLAVASLVSSSDPGSVSASMLTKMLQYIKFMNISYSQRLELTFKDLNSTYGPYKLGPKMPLNLILEAPYYPIPSRFLKFDVYSSFLVNFWDSMIFLSIIFGILFLVTPIEWILSKIKKKPVPYPIIRTIRGAIQCFSLMQFYNVFGDIILFSVLELKEVDLVNATATLSFTLSIVFLSGGCIILGMHIYILSKFYKLRRKDIWQEEIQDYFKKYEGSGVFFKHFKSNTFASQSFLLFFVIRNCVFNLTIALLPELPIIQTPILLTMSVFMVLYLVVQRPFKTRVNLLQQIICEVILLIVNVCVLLIPQLNYEDSDAYKHRDGLCEVIIYIGLVANYVPQLFLVIKVVVAVIEWHQMSKKKAVHNDATKDKALRSQRRPQNDMLKLDNYQSQQLNESSIELSMIHNMSNLSQQTDNSPTIEFPGNNTIPLQPKERELKDKKIKSIAQRPQRVAPMNPLKRLRELDHHQFHQQQDVNSNGILRLSNNGNDPSKDVYEARRPNQRPKIQFSSRK